MPTLSGEDARIELCYARSSANVVYAATEVGVFASDDGGAHWTTSNDGHANVVAEEITFMHGGRRLVLATLGRGIWTADVARPRAIAFGSDCGQTTPPTLTVDPLAPARVGQTMIWRGADLRVGQPFAMLLLGASNTLWNGVGLPLSLATIGMTNCQLFVSVDVTFPTGISGTGTAAWSVPLPDSPALIGRSVFTQLLVPDPGVNPAGLVVSRGLQVTLGW